MAITRNLAWLREQLARKLNFNTTQTDQDFAGTAGDTYKLLDTYLSEAYSREVNAAKIELGFTPFSAVHSFTWAASTRTLALPRTLLDQQILRLEDTTDQSPGIVLWVGRDGSQTTVISWYDRNTLQWGTTGPSAARTITAFYVADAVEMHDPLAEPDLIPPQHRHLLIWEAAIIARAEADEKVPEEWKAQHFECRNQYHSLLANGVIVGPLNYYVREPGDAGSSSGTSTTAGIGGGIG